ncbi:MAG: hypothetical protein RLZZ436_4535 [Planctomycetota bacterium]|jgi:hypothetical protein
MSRLVAAWDSIVGSPTWLRDRATLFSGPMVGLTALVLNGVLLLSLFVFTEVPADAEVLLQQFRFGELMVPVLLTGVVVVLSLMVPLRFNGLLMGPRLFRYFDQIVLSGISPLQFLIGRVFSQNLFLLLVLFLFLPWLTLAMVLGGIDWPVFLGDLILVWMYCMMLAMVMAWLSLYMPEWAAMGLLAAVGLMCCIVAITAMSLQFAVFTPIPALLHPLLAGYRDFAASDFFLPSYPVAFLSCAGGMCVVFLGAFLGVHLGPLWGVVRENSTFGEVVCAGDTKQRSRLRFRYHIQRPSELAFFYQNRGGWLRDSEGLVRWLTLVLLVAAPAVVGWLGLKSELADLTRAAVPVWVLLEASTMAQVLHGATLSLAVMLFSQGANTTLQRIPFVCGWRVRVSTLDWVGFLLVLVISTCTCLLLMTPFSHVVVEAIAGAVQQEGSGPGYAGLRAGDISWDVTLITSACAVTVYLLQRLICLICWLKTMAASITAGLWFACLCLAPAVVGVYLSETVSLFPHQQWLGQKLAMLSPLMASLERFNNTPRAFGTEHSLIGFFVLQFTLWVVLGVLMVRRERRLRADLAAWQSGQVGMGAAAEG